MERMVSEPCRSGGSEEEVLEQIAGLAGRLMSPEVEGIGIGVPSVVDTARGIVYNVVGIPSWKEVHLKEYLENRFGIPAGVDNDCNCFALGATKYGRGSEYSEVMCVTLGTGVGGALVLDGKVYHGRNAGAGEIGSIPYLDKDYEFYCSSRFFVSKGTTGKDAALAARAGDAGALALWKEFGGHVGKLVQMLMYAYDPAAIVFGGSIAGAFPLFEKEMWKVVREFPYPQSVRNLEIFTAEGENPGIVGAASLV